MKLSFKDFHGEVGVRDKDPDTALKPTASSPEAQLSFTHALQFLVHD